MKYQAVRHAHARSASPPPAWRSLRLLGLWLVSACVACGGAVLEPELTSAGSPSSTADAAVPVSRSDGGSSGSARRDASVAPADGGRVGTSSEAGVASPAQGELAHGLLGAYCGNSVADLTQFEAWLGRPVDGILGYTGAASWTDYDSSVSYSVNLWKALDRRVLWSVPLIPKGATLADAAAGKFDDHYRKAAQTLSTFRPQDSVLYVRTGWEFNGDWFPWAAKGKAKEFAGAFQHFVAAFRSVSPRFRFEWNTSIGDVGMNPEEAYPGDDSVDLIGMDFYWKSFDPTDPTAAWNKMLTQKYGLQWHQAFAAAHGKRTTYAEWGVMYDNAAVYVQNAKAWFDAHDIVYQSYWNSDADYKGKLSSGQYAATGSAYRATFGL
ncbi:MAG: hypothetical protein JWN48_4229 [Myxococcaceae bacterium]|nr:hypothetical protein [Myxococcaceae bacterium]